MTMQRFRDAVEQYRHRVYTFSYYCLGNSEDAEDVTQEVLLRLWRNWRKLNGSDPLGWLMRVTKNACVDVARKRRSYRAVVSEGDCEDVLAGAVDGRPDPRSALERSDLRGRVERALGRLDEPYRSIVILREIQGMTYAEISESLEMPMNTVKVYLHRGRRMLRDRLRERVGNETV
jgi:RNA polymerase sigma-70 factor (ECF subfamily)